MCLLEILREFRSSEKDWARKVPSMHYCQGKLLIDFKTKEGIQNIVRVCCHSGLGGAKKMAAKLAGAVMSNRVRLELNQRLGSSLSGL